MDRKNIKRGLKKTPSPASGPEGLRPGGQDDVSLYVLACKIFANFPFELKIMLRPATHIRYHITVILAVHWLQFVAQYKRWIRP